METVKKTNDYIVFKKRSGRYGVRNAAGVWLNNDDKVKILVSEGLIKAAPVKAEAPAEEAAPEAEETAAE